MASWWGDLSAWSRAFYLAAVFFSTMFVWQFVSSVAGLAGEASPDAGGHGGDFGGHGGDLAGGHAGDLAGHGGDWGHGGDHPGDAAVGHDGPYTDAAGYGHDGDSGSHDDAGLQTFRLLSIRSLLAFGTLFSWAGALYSGQGGPLAWAMVRALLWGFTGMLVVAAFFWMLPRLTEEGTARLGSAVGETGTVYIDIPEDGVGQVRVTVSGALSFVHARARNNQRLSAGTSVRVVRLLDESTIEVEETES